MGERTDAARNEGADDAPLLKDPFQRLLEHQGVVVLDGGLATSLEAAGCDLDDPLWSARVLLDAPEVISRVHMDFLEAGADVIASSTYQATLEGFAGRGLGEAEGVELLRTSVRLAMDARDDFWSAPERREGRLRPLVAASVGPYGAFLADGSEYTGDYDLDVGGLEAFHRRRWHILAESGADLMGCETIPSASEAEALLRLLEETPDTWAWLSFQCRDPERLADGSPLAEAVRACDGAPAVVGVGVNCVPPDRVPALVEEVRRETDKPILVYPNSGEVYDAARKAWSGEAPASDWVREAPGWREEGARIIGGCCRTGAGHIRRLRRGLLG